jgi:hypothetical protein
LKALYLHFQIPFSEDDEFRVLQAVYMQEKPVIRLYREVLFQKVAKRAIENAEFLLKKSGNPKTGDSRLFVENKKLINENQRLKSELDEVRAIVQLE